MVGPLFVLGPGASAQVSPCIEAALVVPSLSGDPPELHRTYFNLCLSPSGGE